MELSHTKNMKSLGTAAVLAASLCFSTGGLLMKIVPWNPLAIHETDFSAPVLISVFLLGAVQVGLAYIFFTFGTKYTDPVTASIINALEPILNPILVAVFYGEMLGRISIVGAVIVLCGILYYNLRKIR